MSVEEEEQGATVYKDEPSGPNVSWKLQNVQTGEWVEINGKFDQGSNVTNIPIEYAEKLGLDLQREHPPILIDTVGGKVHGYLVDLNYEFGGRQFEGRIIFRPGDTAPLLGAEPIFQHFNVYFDNTRAEVEFVPISVEAGRLSLDLGYVNSVMHLKRMVAYAVAGTGGKG